MAAKRASSKQKRSKQKRSKQNRAQRAALEARKKAANEPRDQRRGSTSGGSGTRAADAAAAPAGGKAEAEPKKGFFANARESRGPRPGDVPVDIATLEGGWFSKRLAVPGGRQVLTAAALTIVLSVFLLFTSFPEPGTSLDEVLETIRTEGPAAVEGVEPATSQSFGEAFGTAGYLVIGAMVGVMVFAAQMILSPHRRRIWIGCSFVVALAVVFGMLQYLFPVGFLTYAVWRAAKVEGPAPSRRAKARSPRGDDADDAAEADADDA